MRIHIWELWELNNNTSFSLLQQVIELVYLVASYPLVVITSLFKGDFSFISLINVTKRLIQMPVTYWWSKIHTNYATWDIRQVNRNSVLTRIRWTKCRSTKNDNINTARSYSFRSMLQEEILSTIYIFANILSWIDRKSSNIDRDDCRRVAEWPRVWVTTFNDRIMRLQDTKQMAILNGWYFRSMHSRRKG